MKYPALVASFFVLALASARAQSPGDAGVEPVAKPKDYDLTVTQSPTALAPGQTGRLVINIQPHAPWTLKVATPFEASLLGSAGLAVDKTKLGVKDFLDAKTPDKSIAVGFTADRPGDHTIQADLSFFLCTEQVCQRFKESVQHKVLVQ